MQGVCFSIVSLCVELDLFFGRPVSLWVESYCITVYQFTVLVVTSSLKISQSDRLTGNYE